MTDKFIISPLRYPGSKRKLAKYVEKVLIENNLKPKLFIELFAGGANVALYLLQKKLVDKVILVDKDPWIASFWETVFWDTEWLKSQIQNADLRLENWYHLKYSPAKDRRERAWRCFFLNRTSFSGILRDEVGPLGGKQQKSEYKIDCRFSKPLLTSRIEKIASLRDKIFAVWNMSYEEAVEKIYEEQAQGKIPNDNLFFYLDPPFFKKGSKLYRMFFTYDDHIRLRNFLIGFQDKWLLSYDSVEEVKNLYKEPFLNSNGNTKIKYIASMYSVSSKCKRGRNQEIILSNLDYLPEFE